MVYQPKYNPTNRKLRGARQLLEAHGLPLNAESFLNCLQGVGIVEIRTYTSTTGSGEIKQFVAVHEEWQSHGANLGSHFHPIKTEPRFYEDTFKELYKMACEYAISKIDSIK